MRIAIAGSGQLSVHIARPLLESRHEVVAMLQDGRANRGFNRRLFVFLSRLTGGGTPLSLAMKRGIPVLWIDKMSEKELAPLRELAPDLLIVAGFGIILKKPLLDLPKVGCINAHTSLLPKHRGPNPFTAAILADEAETGVTFHVMDEDIDTGAILEQVAFPIGPKDTALTVYRNAARACEEHIVELVDRIESEGLQGTPQDTALASYDKKLNEEQVRIDWAKPAVEIDRLVRACLPSQRARFQHGGNTVYILQVSLEDAPVEAAPGTVVKAAPIPVIATGKGSVKVVRAYTKRPVPWIWPAPWGRPRPGERLA